MEGLKHKFQFPITNFQKKIQDINLEKTVVFLWLLFIPTQLGRHFWPEWSHVLGLRVDYLSPTLYLLDVLWILLIISNFQKTISKQISISKKQFPKEKIFNFQNLIILLFVGVNILVAENKWEAVYKWGRIVQWGITLKLILGNKDLFKEMLLKVVPIWLIGEGLLAVSQVINGGSINGIFYWLGERRFSYSSLGVAQISWMGEGIIRAYGTFSHPNSLAGFMLVSLLLLFKAKKRNWVFWMVVFISILGIFLAGSRVVWVLTVLLIIKNYELRITNWKQKLGGFLILGGLVVLIFSLISNNYRISDFVGGWDSDGLAKRGALIVASLGMIKDNPLFGVGMGNFLVRLPQYQQNSGVFWLQPVHNIIFLLISEIGILGFILIMKLLIIDCRLTIKGKTNLIILGVILITGMMDHYWLTLPQNWWLMCAVLATI